MYGVACTDRAWSKFSFGAFGESEVTSFSSPARMHFRKATTGRFRRRPWTMPFPFWSPAVSSRLPLREVKQDTSRKKKKGGNNGPTQPKVAGSWGQDLTNKGKRERGKAMICSTASSLYVTSCDGSLQSYSSLYCATSSWNFTPKRCPSVLAFIHPNIAGLSNWFERLLQQTAFLSLCF
jgi:hypothetical protein